MYTSFNLAAAAYTPVRLIVRKIRYLFIEFTENVLYRDIYRYRDMNDLYRDMIFWSYRPALFCIKFKILLLTYKFRHALAPRYLSDLLHPYTPCGPSGPLTRTSWQFPTQDSRPLGIGPFACLPPLCGTSSPPTSAVPLQWRLSKRTRKHTVAGQRVCGDHSSSSLIGSFFISNVSKPNRDLKL